MKDRVKQILAAVAPTIATAVGGPLAGAAVAELAARFTDGDPEKVDDFLLHASPEELAEVKKADQEFALRMKELGIKLEEVNAADRADARGLAKETSLKPQVILSGLFLTGYFVVLGMFIGGVVDVPAGFRDSFTILLGVITASVPSIMQFWFGSSSGSKEKDRIKLPGGPK